jgi:NADH-quinone oxidoreductase subunit A
VAAVELDLGSGFFLPHFVKKVTKSPAAKEHVAIMGGNFELATYVPILLYLAIVLGMVASMLVMAHTIGPKRRTAVKDMPYESGMDPIGDSRQRFDVKFYLIAILFLVFDVELLFLYPWAVVAYETGGLPDLLRGPVFCTMLSFLATLAVAYVYALRKGVFRWR